MHRGHVKVWRKQKEWEWYRDGNTFRVFHEIYTTANWKDKKHQGIVIKRGELLTSPKALGGHLGLTPRQIRTALDKLKSTFDISTKATNRYTIVTVCNYDTYNPLEGDKKPASGHTNVTQKVNQMSTTKKGKEEKKEKPSKSSSKFVVDNPPEPLECFNYYMSKRNYGFNFDTWLDNMATGGWTKGNGDKLTSWKLSMSTWQGIWKDNKKPPWRDRWKGKNYDDVMSGIENGDETAREEFSNRGYGDQQTLGGIIKRPAPPLGFKREDT
jgi:hypothetical protein